MEKIYHVQMYFEEDGKYTSTGVTKSQLRGYLKYTHHIDVLDRETCEVVKVLLGAKSRPAKIKEEAASSRSYLNRPYVRTDGPISASAENEPKGTHYHPIHSHSTHRSHA